MVAAPASAPFSAVRRFIGYPPSSRIRDHARIARARPLCQRLPMASVSLAGVSKSFGVQDVLQPLSLEIPDREFLVLVGPSGCGKSTLLRMIAGLEDVTAGTIAIDGRVVNALAPKDRDVAMVFQDYALYPHMTVFENMAFGLIYRDHTKVEIRRRVEEAAQILSITD